jgi:hypothetical protein
MLVRIKSNQFMKRKSLIIISIFYIIVLTIFSIFWGKNFTKFVHIKGDDFFVCLGGVVVISYVFLTTLFFTGNYVTIPFLLIMPLIIAVISIIVGFVLLLFLNIGGTPSQTTNLYSLTYGTLLLITLYSFIKKKSRFS